VREIATHTPDPARLANSDSLFPQRAKKASPGYLNRAKCSDEFQTLPLFIASALSEWPIDFQLRPID
jgi:hypothetical protein